MWRTLALAISVIAVPSAAQSTGGITYACDTAPGHFSELVLPAPGQRFSVVGNIQVLSIAKDKKWAPTARIRIATAPAAPGHSPSAYGGLHLTALPGKAVAMSPETIQAFSFDVAGGEGEMIRSTIQATGAIQPFRLTFDGQSVAVAIGAESRTFPLTTSQPVVQVICSTGEFLITGMKLEPSS
jgi:hypothetical protein